MSKGAVGERRLGGRGLAISSQHQAGALSTLGKCQLHKGLAALADGGSCREHADGIGEGFLLVLNDLVGSGALVKPCRKSGEFAGEVLGIH